MSSFDYEKLDVYKAAIQLIVLIEKIIDHFPRGTSRIFGVTTRTLSNWLQRQKQQDLAPKMHGSSPSKIDNNKLRKYIEDHPDSCLREIAEVFSTILQAIFYACKRLKITLKKDPLL